MTARASRVSVVLAEDHPVYGEGIAAVLREWPELDLVAHCADGREALDVMRRRPPDVAVVDVQMPEVDGLGVLRAVARELPEVRVLMLSGHAERSVYYEALEAGAAGFLTKDASGREIAEAIRAVARGETVIAPAVAAALAGEIRQRRSPEQEAQLSPRELEILRLLAAGESAPDIAAQLQLGTTTVKTHLRNLYSKLGVADRAAAVAEGMRRGLIE